MKTENRRRPVHVHSAIPLPRQLSPLDSNFRRIWACLFGAHQEDDSTTPRGGGTNSWDEKLLCEKTYHYKCADFGLKTSWNQERNLTAVVYAWDTWEAAKSDDAKRTPGVVSNYIATLTFNFDKKSAKFIEKK